MCRCHFVNARRLNHVFAVSGTVEILGFWRCVRADVVNFGVHCVDRFRVSLRFNDLGTKSLEIIVLIEGLMC